MKRIMLALLLVGSFAPRPAVGETPRAAKSFQSGVSGLGYRWDFCREGDAMRYVVFAYGPRPREMGEEKPGQWVSVTGPASRNPKATLRLRAKEQRDLLASPDLVYQISRDGKVSTYDERVTVAELNAFMASTPQEYTAEALLKFVRERRTVAE